MLFFSPQDVKPSASNIFFLCPLLGLFATLLNICSDTKPGVMYTMGSYMISANCTALATLDNSLVSRMGSVSWMIFIRKNVGMDGFALMVSLILLVLEYYLSTFRRGITSCESPDPDRSSTSQEEFIMEEPTTLSKAQKRNGRKRARARAARTSPSPTEAEPVEVVDEKFDTSFTSKSSPSRIKRTDATKYHLKKRSQDRSPITAPPKSPVKKSPKKSKKKTRKRFPLEDVRLSLPSMPFMEALEGAPTGGLIVRPYIQAPLSVLPTWFSAYISPDLEWVVLTPPGYFWSTANRDFESYEEIFGPINVNYTPGKAWVPSGPHAPRAVNALDASLKWPAMPKMESIEESNLEVTRPGYEYEFIDHRTRNEVQHMCFSPFIEDVIYDVDRDLWRRIYRFLSIEDEFPDWESTTIGDIEEPVHSSSPPPSYQESDQAKDTDLKAAPVIVLAEALKND